MAGGAPPGGRGWGVTFEDLQPPPVRDLLSIGEVAEATGLTPDVLRIWERRYGVPRPLRLPSGHRRYPTSELVRLRTLAEACAAGQRPGSALRAATAGEAESPVIQALAAWDARALRAALGLEGALGLTALRRAEVGLRDLERAESLGQLPGAAWSVEVILEALRGPAHPGRPQVLLVPAGAGGRFMEVRTRLVGAAFRVQGQPELALGRPWAPEAVAALVRQGSIPRVVVPLGLEGPSRQHRQAVHELRSALPRTTALWVCGPGQRRAPREPGVEARCGVRRHTP
jgi:hypothetical protein